MSFKNITNQEHIINFLRASLKSNRVAGSYLFIGQEGKEKEKLAKEFAKLLNCQEALSMDSCDECLVCKKIDEEKLVDVHWYRSENNSVVISQVRDLEKYMYLRPYEAKYKVFVICDAQSLTEEASNALLKTLEEPKRDSILILIATDESKLLPTISSRCQKLVFNALDEMKIKDILIKEHNLPLLQAHLISYLAEGSLDRALSYKDLKDDLFEKRQHILNAIYFKKFSIYKMEEFDIKDSKEKRKSLNILLDMLLSWFRDLLVLKSGLDTPLINIDKKEELKKINIDYSKDDILNNISTISNTKSMLGLNVNVKLAFSKMRADLWK